jgi:hypothetical protein
MTQKVEKMRTCVTGDNQKRELWTIKERKTQKLTSSCASQKIKFKNKIKQTTTEYISPIDKYTSSKGIKIATTVPKEQTLTSPIKIETTSKRDRKKKIHRTEEWNSDIIPWHAETDHISKCNSVKHTSET